MAETSKRQSMGSVDKAWLEMDRETNLMIINGVMIFDGKVDYAALRDTFERRMVARFPLFRRRAVESSVGSGRIYWADDPYFDIRSHLLHIALPEPGTTATLQSLIGDLMSTELDRSKPLWRVYLIDNYEGGSALFVRLHHSLADGVALVQVILSMFQTEDGAPLSPPVALAPETRRRRGLLHSTARLACRTTVRTAEIAGGLVRESIATVRHPREQLDTAFDAAVSGSLMAAASAAVLARLVIIPPDRESVFQGELSAAKRVLWSEPIDLQQIKAIGRATGSTVNDVLIAALTGALRGFMDEEGDDVNSGDLRAMVPISLRSADAPLSLGNQFGMVYLTLPVSLEDPLARLFVVKQRMDMLKSSPEAVVVYQVLNLLGMLPGELAAHAVDIFATKASAVLTNVPGPQRKLYFDGSSLQRIMFWVPQSGNIGLGISIISYDGQVTLGIVIDEKLVENPQRILDRFLAEFRILAKQVSEPPAAINPPPGTMK